MKNTISQIDTLPKVAKDTLVAILSSKTLTEASDRLDVTRQTLYDRVDRFGLQKYIDEIPRTALNILKTGSIKAAETLVGALGESRNKMVAAESILDRVGVGKTPQVMIQNNQVINEVEFILDEGKTT